MINQFRNLLVLLLTTTGCQAQNDSEQSFSKLEWLIGTWQGDANGQPFYENWTKLSDYEFANINFSLCNGDTVISGHSKIEMRNNKVAYTSSRLTLELKSIEDNQVIFENKQYGETFTFSKTEKGEWIALLVYPRSRVEYKLQRTVPVAELLKNKPPLIEGNFSGYIEFNGKKLETSINFTSLSRKQIATASTPGNLQLNMPFNTICYNPPFLKLTLQDGTRLLELNAKLENDSITGKVGGEIPAKIHLKKQSYRTPVKNYSIESISLLNGKIVMPANLYLPKSTTITGAVIMICGSGRHVKEEYNGWADMLASKGIAVLTYDKRNVTDFPNLNIRQRTSDIVQPGELESDVQVAIDLLKRRKEIDPQKIGLIGFSQGAVIAPVVGAGNPDLAFIAMISGNTTTDKEFIINQTLNKLKARNFSKETIDNAEMILNALFKYVTDKKDGPIIQRQLDKAYADGYGQLSLPRQLPNEDEIKYLSTWNSFTHDPAKYLRSLTMPIYVVFGDKDELIPVQRSLQILDTIFAGKMHLITIRTYANADHFIKTIPDRNNFDFPKYAPGYIEELSSWIMEKVR